MLSTTKIRLHLLGLPHTICSPEFSHCAFTGKVQRFSPMMRSLSNYEVYFYGIAGGESGANKDIDLMNVDEWQEFRLKSLQQLEPTWSLEKCQTHLAAKSSFVGQMGNVGTPLYQEFNRRLKLELPKYYRGTATDIVCLPFGYAHADALVDNRYVQVETGIGYVGSYCGYRIFESYAHLHQTLQKEEKGVQNYWFVAPNYYNLLDWHKNEMTELTKKNDRPRIGFFGRIMPLKGCCIVRELAQRFPLVDFILCGQGAADEFLLPALPNLFYLPPLEGRDRADYLHSLTALIAPSLYMEPFCGVNVEAQLCGCPVLTHDFGAFVETVEPMVTGVHCHTLADFGYGIMLAMNNHFDRTYIRLRAERLYNMFNVAHKYDYIFKTILDVHNGQNGWYSPNSHLPSSLALFCKKDGVQIVEQDETKGNKKAIA